MKKPKILLIHPRLVKEGSWCRAPLNLLVIASCLNPQKYEVKIIDCMIEPDYTNLVQRELEGSICVGISALTGFQINNGLIISKKIKEINPNIPIVWGGWHASIMPHQTLANPYIDIIIKGQGEESFKELVQCLEKKEGLRKVKGILFKENNRIIETPMREVRDVNNFPPANYSLIKVDDYFTTELNTKTINYTSSRGCPYNCGFCADSLIYRKMWRGLKAGRVVKELKELKEKYGVNGVVFEDNNFFVDPNRVKDICEGFIKNSLAIKWHADGRASNLLNYDEKLVRLLKESGCVRILVGAESGSDKILKIINKGESSAALLKFAEWGKKHNIWGRFSFIWGLPCETKYERKKTIKIINAIKKIDARHEVLAFFYTSYPGTPLATHYPTYGKEAKSLEEWGSYDLNNLNTNTINEKEKTQLEEFINFYLIYAYPSNNQNINNRLLRSLSWILKMISRMRIDLNFFSFPFEKVVLNGYLKLKSSTKIPFDKGC